MRKTFISAAFGALASLTLTQPASASAAVDGYFTYKQSRFMHAQTVSQGFNSVQGCIAGAKRLATRARTTVDYTCVDHRARRNHYGKAYPAFR